jgi:hypothetical protein
VKGQAKAVSYTSLAIIMVLLVMQIFMKSQMENLWSMFFAMQLLCFMDIYEIPTPANVVIFIDEFKKMITFELLNPEGIV